MLAAKTTATIDLETDSSARFPSHRATVHGVTTERMRAGRCSFCLKRAFELSEHVDEGMACANIFFN